MSGRRFGLRAVSGMCIFLTVAVFALMCLLTVVFGAGVYRSVVERGEHSYDVRTAIAYVTGKLRASSGEVAVEQTEAGNNMLLLKEQIGQTQYETRIYAHEGALYELFTASGISMEPDQGQRIAAVEDFQVSLEQNMVCLTLRTGGEDYSAHVALWE